nr:hypothetical protein [Tanacetum cinerariifolium]
MRPRLRQGDRCSRDAATRKGVAVAGDPESENVSSPAEVGSPGSVACRDQRIQARESEIKNLKALLETEAGMKRAAEEKSQDQMVEQRCAEMDARLDAMSIDFDEELYPRMLTAIAGRRQAFADVVSARVAKGISESLKHGVEHGHAQRTVESLEAYDPEAEAKFAAALQSLKDLKYPLLDQLEGLRD